MNRTELINEILSLPDFGSVVLDLVTLYASSNSKNRLKEIATKSLNLYDMKLDTCMNQLKEKDEMINLLMVQLEEPSLSKQLFCIIPVCKKLFPAGRCFEVGTARARYFQRFLDLLTQMSSEEFDQIRPALDTLGYTDYLKSVLNA